MIDKTLFAEKTENPLRIEGKGVNNISSIARSYKTITYCKIDKIDTIFHIKLSKQIGPMMINCPWTEAKHIGHNLTGMPIHNKIKNFSFSFGEGFKRRTAIVTISRDHIICKVLRKKR